MSKFQVPSSNGVGCGDDTHIHTHIATNQTLRKVYSTSDFFLSMFCVNRIGLEVK